MYHKMIVESYEKGKETMQFILTCIAYVTRIELYKNRNDEEWTVKYYVPNKNFIKKNC